MRRASAGGPADYAGITYERIAREDGVFWPCPSEDHPGTPRLFLERFATADVRARFHPVEYRSPAEEPDAEYPLYLTTGRVMAAGNLVTSCFTIGSAQGPTGQSGGKNVGAQINVVVSGASTPITFIEYY